ncbi:snoRNA-binding rRNA-processing protein utp10 [Conoideocrella luteorostrata]|uniref:U3 small nucleolar RNA-associated protein 10 n=1 Tax=Conoideocrella luteorostrata TaxID=1105319 RepID=A0AAJ0CG67_9HYPO|nr:snoRNA-binding rRNA-processing protein utp10 [Conoideocrella luteorostrata]
MVTSLAAQLAQIAANSKATLDIKAQKAAHSKSLIWEPRVAATQSYQTLYTTCLPGFEELCQLDSRFVKFQSTIFGEESQSQDRSQLSSADNEELDRHVEAFLRLAGSRLRLMPAIKAVEWLIRRFRIHEENTTLLLMTFLPYHSIPVFATLLSILPAKLPHEFRFLDPYARSLTAPTRSVLVHQAVHHPEFLSSLSEYTLESCRKQYQFPALIVFWGGIMTEAVNGMLDRAKSGRAAVQSDNVQALLHRLGPIFAESLVMKRVPSLQIASYMAMAIFVSKGNLEDVAVTALMQQTVHGWTNETVRPGLVCLAILAQFRSAKQMNNKVTKALMKVQDIGPLLVDIGKERRVDKLANGLCLALIERFTKKGDSRGLPTIMAILDSQILKEKQTTVIFKSLLLTALKLDDNNDEGGTLRRELGSALIALSQTAGKSGDIIQSVIQDVEFDIEELEMKLDLSFRVWKLPAADVVANEETQHVKRPQNLGAAIEKLSSKKEGLSECLLPEPNELFEEFSHLFFSIVSESSQQTEILSKFDEIPHLGRKTALQDCKYFSFFIRIWCGPYPALARVAALNMVRNRLQSSDDGKTDVQALIPYAIVALSDPSKRVRQAAAHLIDAVTVLYTPPLIGNKSVKNWGFGSLYGKAKDKSPLAPEITAKLLHMQILPAVEECVMDPEHISSVLKSVVEHGKYQIAPQSALDEKNHMGQSTRLAVLSFLSSHAELTPLLLVKNRLLKSLNEVKGVGSTSRTKVLLPLLNWWVNLREEDIMRRCQAEQVDATDMDSRFVDIMVPNDMEGIRVFTELIQGTSQRHRTNLMRAIFGRIRRMWTSMKDEVKFSIAEQCLLISHPLSATDDTASVVPTEASDLLRAVPLTTFILSYFLDAVQTGTKMVTEPLPNKRRRASSSDANRILITQVTPELSQALRKFTFVLQLVDNSDPVSHPELLDGLFTALSELQHFRTVVGSELGYLQNLILRSLLAMMPAYKANKNLKIDSSGGYGDLLVNCIQKSSSPVVQNAALLLVANLATTAPNLVLHSVMPIFTFMSSSVLRQSDDYSAHVVSQTIREVIPPLIESLRKGKKGPVAGASDILVSFTTAYEHIPSHRRLGLFVALVETLGPRNFLSALICMLVDRYDTSEALLSFIVELLNDFDIKTQLHSFVGILDLAADLLKPKPTMSFLLLGISEDGDDKDVDKIALRQLSALPSFLASKKLRSQISKLAEREDMDAAEVRDLYATLLEKILILADTVKANKALHGRCGSALSNLLNLLSISEFIKAVENLLNRPDLGMRQKVLRALEVRVEAESHTDPASRNSLLAFLPQLTAAIRESNDIRYKHTAVTCVDKIAEKYGKKDLEAVVAAAETIAGEHCLGQGEKRLRIMALLCLTSLVDVLQDAIVPILPMAIAQVAKYLEVSLEGDDMDEELHSACYGFISSLAEHLPYMLSTYLDTFLEVSNQSAESSLNHEANDSRTSCLEFLAKKLEAKDVFASLDRNWDKAMGAGLSVCNLRKDAFVAMCANFYFQAVTEYLSVLSIAIDKHTKSSITKNTSVLISILIKVFDLRRQVHAKGQNSDATLQGLSDIETSLYETSLKMIYKLNDAAFRPLFVQIIEWTGTRLAKKDKGGQNLRRYSVYGFLHSFFDTLKSIVTNYATYILDDAVKMIGVLDLRCSDDRQMWSRVLQVLATCFEHDQDDFWQAPSHFGVVAPVLMNQFLHAGFVDLSERLIPAVVELAAAADSQAHQKDINAALLNHLKSEQTAVRLAAVKCQQALTDRLGEEWLSMLHEMLPRISELQEDDDEAVERETHRWIVKIEGALGESLDAMLQ